MARTHAKPHFKIQIGLSLGLLLLFSLTGLKVAQTTSAATANPYGMVDYCALENNTTVIYGWAADPDASSLAQSAVTLDIGGATYTASTNRANYRDAAVHNWIDNNRRGDPKPGTYGFRVPVPGLTKGTAYPISGTALNVGPGANVILTVNNSTNIDGDKNKPFLAGNSIPDTCLPDPALAAQPTTNPVTVLPTPKAATSNATGTTVTAGTLAAQLQVTTGNTVTVRVMYGTDPLKLDQSSSDMLITGPETSITLTGLKAATTYNYRVVRADPTGKRTTSPLGLFNTLGFVVATHFVDSRDSGIQGIAAELDKGDKSKTSDTDGTVQFTGVSDGQHTLHFTYLGKSISKSFKTDTSVISPALAATPQVITLDNAVDIQALMTKTAAPVVKPKSNTTLIALIVAIVAVLALITVVIMLLRSVKRRKDFETWAETPAPPLPEYRPLDPRLPPVLPMQPGAAHMGESLSDLLKKDLRDRSKKTPPGTPD